MAKRWLAFLENHRELILAMDFFIVPTLTFGVLYRFFRWSTGADESCTRMLRRILVRSG
jgi:hypothetical protein